MLFRFVIPYLARSKCFLISWLQSSSAVILEPKKIKRRWRQRNKKKCDQGNRNWSGTARETKEGLEPPEAGRGKEEFSPEPP